MCHKFLRFFSSVSQISAFDCHSVTFKFFALKSKLKKKIQNLLNREIGINFFIALSSGSILHHKTFWIYKFKFSCQVLFLFVWRLICNFIREPWTRNVQAQTSPSVPVKMKVIKVVSYMSPDFTNTSYCNICEQIDLKNVIKSSNFYVLTKVPHCMWTTQTRAKVPNSFSKRMKLLYNTYWGLTYSSG